MPPSQTRPAPPAGSDHAAQRALALLEDPHLPALVDVLRGQVAEAPVRTLMGAVPEAELPAPEPADLDLEGVGLALKQLGDPDGRAQRGQAALVALETRIRNAIPLLTRALDECVELRRMVKSRFSRELATKGALEQRRAALQAE